VCSIAEGTSWYRQHSFEAAFVVGMAGVSMIGRIANGDIIIETEVDLLDRCWTTQNGGQINGCKEGMFRKCLPAKPNCRPVHKDNDIQKPIIRCECQA
jgi:hypothetical protein